MNVVARLAISVCLWVVLCSRAAQAEVNLIRGGRVTADIVVADNATPLEEHAASLLGRYLTRMAGSNEPPVALRAGEAAGGNGAVVYLGRPGTHTALARLVDSGSVTLSSSDPGGDGFVIKTGDGSDREVLVLGGSSERAVLHAAVHFLEHFGKVGVFWDGEHVPRRTDWKIESLDVREKPHFPIRQYLQGCAFSYSYMNWWNFDQLSTHLDWAAWKKQSRVMWPGGFSGEHNQTTFGEFSRAVLEKSRRYGREKLGIEFMHADDHLYNRDPYPEKRVSEDIEEEKRILAEFAKKTLADIRAEDPVGVWYASGWALFNPGWSVETAKAFFDAIGDESFYICDIWAEVHPIYKKYDYFYGKEWGFGVLHSFGGSTTLHGDAFGLIRRVRDVAQDSRASKCVAFYINPEVLFYNDFYFDLAARLSWDPLKVELGSFIDDYVERRYGPKAKPIMGPAYRELMQSVYSTDDRTAPLWQNRMGVEFSPQVAERLRYVPHLQRALALALTQRHVLAENPMYGKDLVDIAKQMVGEVFNGIAVRFYNAFLWKDAKRVTALAKGLRSCLNVMEVLLASRKEYWLRPILDQIASYQGVDKKLRVDAELFFKDAVMTFATHEELRDYNHRDIKELFDMYYRPRVEAYISALEEKATAGQFEFDAKTLDKAYGAIENRWLATPVPAVKIEFRAGADAAAAERAQEMMRSLAKSLIVQPVPFVRNGGFEEGPGEPIGWQSTIQNMGVEVKPHAPSETVEAGNADAEGGAEKRTDRYALHFVADDQSRYKTLTLEQRLRWKTGQRVGARYRIDRCSPWANASLRVDGYDATGKKRVQVLYFWGRDSWDHKTALPETTGGYYTVANSLPAPKGEWQEFERDPLADLDAIHGQGTWKAQEIKTVSLGFRVWVFENNGHHIEGWVDEVRVSQEE